MDAAQSGKAFFVVPARHVLAIDADQPADAAKVDAIAQQARDLGLTPVITESGGEGHRDLFIRIIDASTRSELAARARARSTR